MSPSRTLRAATRKDRAGAEVNPAAAHPLAAAQLGRFSICQSLQPDAQGDALPLGRCPVPLPVSGRHTDVYTHAGGVFQGGSTPAPFGLIHALNYGLTNNA